VVGERRFPDADGFREFPLVTRPADLEVEQDQPDRQRAVRRRERLLEGALDHPGRRGQTEPDRHWVRL
jgi:hypothetical protein